MNEYKYIGPKYPKGHLLNIYGRTIDPASWTDDECKHWFQIDERLKNLFVRAGVPTNSNGNIAIPAQK